MRLAPRHAKGSQLRKEFINHMRLRNLSECTVHSYMDAVLGLVKHYGGRSPEKITEEMVQQYFLYRRNKEGVAWSTLELGMYGVRYLYKEILWEQRGQSLKLN